MSSFTVLHQLGIAMFRTVYLLCIWFLFQVVFLKKYWFCSPALDGSSQFAIMQTRKRRLKVVADSAEKGNFTQFRLKIMNTCPSKPRCQNIPHQPTTSYQIIWYIYSGYYMAVRVYKFYLGVLKVSLTSERSEWVRNTFSTRR